MAKTTEKAEVKSAKRTINPQLIGATKLVLVSIVLGAVFYAGTQYQEQYHTQVNNAAKTLVAELKANQ